MKRMSFLPFAARQNEFPALWRWGSRVSCPLATGNMILLLLPFGAKTLLPLCAGEHDAIAP